MARKLLEEIFKKNPRIFARFGVFLRIYNRGTLFLDLAFFKGGFMSEEIFKAWVAERINNKGFDGHWDNVRRNPLGSRGRETWINGNTGLADIQVTKTGTGMDEHYVAQINIPVSSTYRRKTFIGVGSEYREESWGTTYRYRVTYLRGILTNRLENESFTDHSTSADHDAVQFSHQELRNDVFSRLTSG